MPLTPQRIEALCQAWCDASSPPGGGFVIGDATEQYRLVANGVQFHELDFDALCAALIGTARTLLRPGMNTVIVEDHYLLWAWCAQLLVGPNQNYYAMSLEDTQLRKIFETCASAALAHVGPRPRSREEHEQQSRQRALIPHRMQSLVQESGLLTAHLAFPLLESIAKRTCSTFVGLDGVVISPFRVPRASGGVRDYSTGQKCSSLRDLLCLLIDQVADAPLRDRLLSLLAHFRTLEPNEEPIDLIYRWRCESLHGSTSYATIGGSIFTLCILIALSRMTVAFETARDDALQHIQWAHQPGRGRGFRPHWEYYPPY